MTCTNEKCKYAPVFRPQMYRTPDQIWYAQLWLELEMPEELRVKEVRA